MEMTEEELVALIQRVVSGSLPDPVEPEPVVTEPEPVGGVPDPAGPLALALSGVMMQQRYVWAINDFSALRKNRFRRTDVYDLLVFLIEMAEADEEVWITGSVPSWVFTREALMTRSSEVSGDMMSTEFEPIVSYESGRSGVNYGVAERLANTMDLSMRRMIGAWQAQSTDRDLGPKGELLTNGECLRLCFILLDFMTDHKLVPTDPDSSFMKVRAEIHDQYKAMGEGVFGPWAHPGGPVPWSWGGQ